tara:strand:- start:806 stop:1438 length:633 start_codon:yes stop_codon:yes gene_type:complete
MNKILHLLIIIVFVSCSKDSAKKTAASSKTSVYSPGAYELVTDSSKVAWLGTEITTKTHFGSLKAKSGNVLIDQYGNVDGKVTIDMQSLLVEDLTGRSKEILERHLKSDDFFGIEQYPTATLTFRSSNRYNDNGDHLFSGDLTIKGITNEVEFSSKLIKQSPLLRASGKLVFDRSKFNVKFRSGSFFDGLGDKLILDDIEVDINIVAEPA